MSQLLNVSHAFLEEIHHLVVFVEFRGDEIACNRVNKLEFQCRGHILMCLEVNVILLRAYD